MNWMECEKNGSSSPFQFTSPHQSRLRKPMKKPYKVPRV